MPICVLKAERCPYHGADAEAVIDYNEASVSRALAAGLGYDAIGSGADGVAVMRRDIHASVESTLTTKGIQALAKMPGNLPTTGHSVGKSPRL